MKANKQPFYYEFMTKKSPRVPQCICTRGVRRWLGIISPSLYWVVATGAKGEKARLELKAFEWHRLRYMCYKRTMTKVQWKELYREHRKKQREEVRA